MGLHLNFDLHLDGTESEAGVSALLTRLHAHAQSLPLAHVSELHVPFASDAESADDSAALLACWAEVVASVDADLDPEAPAAIPETTIGFVVHPGEGSEPATFGLMRRHASKEQPADWHWRCYCKTQYASVVSDEHFVTCHTSLVRLLDFAASIGIGVSVNDEARYWETRDTAVLLAEVHAMNQMVARIAGRLHDAIGKQNKLEAPIFEHPEFEHLEM